MICYNDFMGDFLNQFFQMQNGGQQQFGSLSGNLGNVNAPQLSAGQGQGLQQPQGTPQQPFPPVKPAIGGMK